MKNGKSDYQEITRVLDALTSLADKSANDESVMTNLGANPHGELTARGVEIPEGVDINIVANSADTIYLVLPPDPNTPLADEALGTVSGGIIGSGKPNSACYGSVASTVGCAASG